MAGEILLEHLLDNPKIPTPPAIALQVLERVGKPDCSLAEIRDIIRHDPALCGLIMKTLNSILYCFSHTVTSIDQALIILGLSRVRSLVLTLYLPAIRNVCRASPHLRDFWKTSVIGAILARELAVRIGRPDPESDLLAGLMRDMGKVVLVQMHPLEYAELQAICHSESEGHLCDRETQCFGINHADVGAALLQRWRLPEGIAKAVACHHHPELAAAHGREVHDRAILLHFASLAAQFLIHPSIPGLRRELLERAMTEYKLSEAQLAEFLTPLNSKVIELGVLLSVDMGCDLNYATVLTDATDELAKLTLQANIESVREQQTKQIAEKDADQWKQVAQRHKEQSLRDPLTGLHNRAFFQECLETELQRMRKRFAMLGLMFIDLDGFKPINDKFGHAFGDQVLKEVSTVLIANMRGTDIISRFGGDEFCVLLPGVPEPALNIIGERVIRAINKMELRFGRNLCAVGASVGIAYCLPYAAPCTAEELMKIADQAMYSSKAGGKNRMNIVSLIDKKGREMVDAVERRSFRAFLVRRGTVTEVQLAKAPGARLSRMCLQRIARKLGWLTRDEACELSRQQRLTRKSFGDLAVGGGYLNSADLWVLLAIQQEHPESIARRIIASGLLGTQEMEEELEAYYLMMRSRGGSSYGSKPGVGGRISTSPIKSTGSSPGFYVRPSSGSRYGNILNRGN